MRRPFSVVVKSPGTFISSSDGEMSPWLGPGLGISGPLPTSWQLHSVTRGRGAANMHSWYHLGYRKQRSLIDVTVSEWNMLLPSQDLMFWWKEVKGVCNSWWQHPRDWVLQLDVSIQWLHTPGLTARASSKPDQCQCLKCVQWASSHLTTSAVSNVNWMSLQKDKNLLKLSNN